MRRVGSVDYLRSGTISESPDKSGDTCADPCSKGEPAKGTRGLLLSQGIGIRQERPQDQHSSKPGDHPLRRLDKHGPACRFSLEDDDACGDATEGDDHGGENRTQPGKGNEEKDIPREHRCWPVHDDFEEDVVENIPHAEGKRGVRKARKRSLRTHPADGAKHDDRGGFTYNLDQSKAGRDPDHRKGEASRVEVEAEVSNDGCLNEPKGDAESCNHYQRLLHVRESLLAIHDEYLPIKGESQREELCRLELPQTDHSPHFNERCRLQFESVR